MNAIELLQTIDETLSMIGNRLDLDGRKIIKNVSKRMTALHPHVSDEDFCIMKAYLEIVKTLTIFTDPSNETHRQYCRICGRRLRARPTGTFSEITGLPNLSFDPCPVQNCAHDVHDYDDSDCCRRCGNYKFS